MKTKMSQRIYIVEPGESLSTIARDLLRDVTRWSELAYINSIAAPYLIQPGQRLVIPADEPLRVTIDTGQAAPVRQAAFVFNPATVALFVAGAALVYFWDDI